MLPPNMRQEAVSRAYMEAVVAHAGATVTWARDDFGIDFTLAEITMEGGTYIESGRKVEFQLKSTRWDGD